MDIQAIGPSSTPAPPKISTDPPKKTEKSFMETLKESILQVNDLQTEANRAVFDLTTGKEQNLHQTMIAVEKADISFQLLMQVRNKIVSAYDEISRIQI